MKRRGANIVKSSTSNASKNDDVTISTSSESSSDLPPFKLYDDLVESIKKRPVDKYVINSICSTIGRFLSLEHRNMLFLIIYRHYQIHNNKSKKSFPYNGNTYPTKKGAAFNMNNFPEDLRHLIVRYIGIASGVEEL
jgi:hypothetical protein